MIKTIQLHNECSRHIASSGCLYSNITTENTNINASTSSAGLIFVVAPVETKPSKSKDIDDFIGELLTQTPTLQNDLSEGRKWAAEALYGEQPTSLKTLRLRAGLSQAELAEKIGMKQPNICEFESGKRKPNLESLRRLSAALGATADELLNLINKAE